jgi:hypothetical protein
MGVCIASVSGRTGCPCELLKLGQCRRSLPPWNFWRMTAMWRSVEFAISVKKML